MKRFLNRLFRIFGVKLFQMSKVIVSKNKKSFKIDDSTFKTKFLRAIRKDIDAGFNFHYTIYYGTKSFGVGYSDRKEGETDLKMLSVLIEETA